MGRMKSERRKLIQGIVQDYVDALPGWKVCSKYSMARYVGPFLQCIWFDILSIDHYRPTNYVCSLVAKSLPQDEISLSQLGSGSFFHDTPGTYLAPLKFHKKVFPKMFEKMKAHFFPRIDLPLLDEHKLLRKCHSDSDHFDDIYALTSLYAYFGKNCRALWCASQYEKIAQREFKIVSREFAHLNEIHIQQLDFLNEIRHWIKEGIVKEKLEEIRLESLKNWKFHIPEN
jgi:hypothetical protein